MGHCAITFLMELIPMLNKDATKFVLLLKSDYVKLIYSIQKNYLKTVKIKMFKT